MFNIEEFLNLDNYVTDEREQRRRHTTKEKVTAEIFTPYSIVKRMCDKVPDETWSDPSKTNCKVGCEMSILNYNDQ